jgi:hypothetical protein
VTDHLKNPWLRDDGLPWVDWESTPSIYGSVAGCRERVELTAWYNADEQRLVMTVTVYDESLRQFRPCWAQVAHVDVGPFLARSEIADLADVFTEACEQMCGVGSLPR